MKYIAEAGKSPSADGTSNIDRREVASALHGYLGWLRELGLEDICDETAGYAKWARRDAAMAQAKAAKSKAKSVLDAPAVASSPVSQRQASHQEGLAERQHAASTTAGRDKALLLYEAVTQARAAAAAASDLSALRQAIEAFAGCDLKLSAKTTVIADGNADAPLMIVGEAPGADEDRQGVPFVGAAGQLLNRMLAAIGRSRRDTYITNVMFWRPPGNRNPTLHEIESVLPFTMRHIELVKPAVVVTMGNVATKALRSSTQGIMKERGSWRAVQFGSLEVATLAMFHPAFLLRQPNAKRLAWEDLQALQKHLELNGNGSGNQ